MLSPTRLLIGTAARSAAAGWLWLAILCSTPAADPEAPTDAAAWNTDLNASLSLARGNSKTLTLNSSLLSKYQRARHQFELELGANYGESEITSAAGATKTEQTTLQNAKGLLEYKYLFAKRSYAYANGKLLHDRIAGINYRSLIGPGLGHYLLKSAKQTLSIEVGIAYGREDLDETDPQDTANLRAEQRYEINLTSKSKLWQKLEITPAIDDFENCFLDFELGAEAAMTERVSLRLVFTDQLVNRPAPGKEKNDLQLVGGLGIKL